MASSLPQVLFSRGYINTFNENSSINILNLDKVIPASTVWIGPVFSNIDWTRQILEYRTYLFVLWHIWFKSQYYTLYHKDNKKFQPSTYKSFVIIALQIFRCSGSHMPAKNWIISVSGCVSPKHEASSKSVTWYRILPWLCAMYMEHFTWISTFFLFCL